MGSSAAIPRIWFSDRSGFDTSSVPLPAGTHFAQPADHRNRPSRLRCPSFNSPTPTFFFDGVVPLVEVERPAVNVAFDVECDI